MTKCFIHVFLIVSIFFVYSCSSSKADALVLDDIVGDASSTLLANKTPKKVSPNEMVAWTQDKSNHIWQERKIGEIVYSMQLLSSEMMYLKENGMTSEIKTKEAKEQISSYDDMYYFNFKIAVEDFNEEFIKYNLGPNDSYENRIKYFSFGMQKDFALVDGKDTLPASLFHFERTYNIAPYGNFMLAFPKASVDSIHNLNLLFDDKIMGTGKVSFIIPKESIFNQPTLDI